MEGKGGALAFALAALLAGGALFPHLSEPTRLVSAIRERTIGGAGDAQSRDAALDAQVKNQRGTDALDLLADFFGLDLTESGVERESVLRDLVKEIAQREHIRLRFLVATVPDPIDSYAGWQFDLAVDAIQQAAADSGWVLDRFYIPDTTAELIPGTPAPSDRRIHERWPGVILFRDSGENFKREGCGESEPCSELLVLFLAFETPTGGVHQAAFTRAVRFMTIWEGSETARTVAVLGPTFSGSTDSLARLVRNLSDAPGKAAHFRFVSGSATNRGNQDALQQAAPGVSFSATVLPDDVLQTVSFWYLKKVNPDIDRYGVAILGESNTDYGHALVHAIGPGWNMKITNLPFPMHISRLRSEATKSSREATVSEPLGGVPSRFRPLSLEDSTTPTDQLPALSPKTTSAYVELRLANILETIRRQNIRTVGLLATDARDKLFLAQEIARAFPDVTLYTIESDLLYAHPDYSAYMARAVVASSYPLYNGSQMWSVPFEGQKRRLQFATSAAEGIYNAALALLDYRENGSPIDEERGAQLVDYAAPGQLCPPQCMPATWISVVGRGTLWPVEFLEKSEPDSYVFVPKLRAAVPLSEAGGHVTAGAEDIWMLFATLTLLAVLHVLACLGIALAGRRRRTLSDAASRALPSGWLGFLASGFLGEPGVHRRRYLLVCVSGLLIADGFVTRLVCLQWTGDATPPVGWPLVTLTAPFVALGLSAAWLFGSSLVRPCISEARALLPAWRLWLAVKSHEAQGRASEAFVWIAVFGLMLWGSWNLFSYATEASGLHALPFIERAAQLGNGVSPTLPVLFLGMALYLWGIVELRRLLTSGSVLGLDGTVPLLETCATGGLADLKAGLRLFGRPILEAPWWGCGLVALAGAGILVFAFDPVWHPLITIEGVSFNRFVTSFVLLLHVMIMLSLIQLAGMWFAFRQVLQRLAWNPLVEAYDRVPAKLLPSTLLPRRPRLIELQVLVSRAQRLETVRQDASAKERGEPTSEPLAVVFQQEVGAGVPLEWAVSRTWASLLSTALFIAAELKTAIQAPPRPTQEPALALPANAAIHAASAGLTAAPSTYNTDPVQAEAATTIVAAVMLKEEFVATSLVFIIRDALARLAHNVIFAASGIMLVFCSEMLFPFQARHRLLAFVWADILIGVAVVLTVFFQMERDEVLSRVSSKTPGEIKWSTDTLAKLLVYGLVPLLTLFAAQFPEVGGTILGWLEPMQKAIP